MEFTRRFAVLHPVFLLVLAAATLGAAEPASPDAGPRLAAPSSVLSVGGLRCEGTTCASDHTYYPFRGASADTIFVGPVLYAGAEVIRLHQNPNLQVSGPRPDAVNSALLMKEKD